MSPRAAEQKGPAFPAVLTDEDLRTIIRILYERSGIVMDEEKRHLILNRLQRRIRALHLHSFREYLERVTSEQGGEEMSQLVDALTTNHTRFFREAQHFEYVVQQVLPRLRAAARPLRIWCAAASSGEEPYSLAMALLEAGHANFVMLASDLSTKVLRTASAGVYPLSRVREVPDAMLHRWFDRGVGRQHGNVRIAVEIRRKIRFEQINLLEVGVLPERFDLILCRNVMIYFDAGNRQKVVSMLERHLEPEGHLFLGLCESLTAIRHGLRPVGPAAFQAGA